MGSAAEFPHIIENLFLTKEINAHGIYAVNLFIRGKPWAVIVDDIFLFRNKGFALDRYHLKAAMIGDDRALWAPIIEKAFAKIKGNYQAIDFGLLKNGLRVLTGAPCFSENLNEYATEYEQLKIFDMIYEAD